MANPIVVSDPHSLSQGNIQNVSDLVFGTPVGDAVTITSVGSNIPVMVDKEFFEIRNHPQTTNNGLYQVDDAAPAAGTTDVRKVSGADPVVDATGRDCDILCSLDTNVTDAVWANQSLDFVDITSVLGLPASLEIGSRFQVRTHSDADNNGAYEVISAVTNGFNCQKLSGAEPNNAASEAVDLYTEQKSVFWDTAALGIYLLEQPGTVVTAVSDAVWGTPVGTLVQITSAGNNLPVVKIGQKVLVTDHATAANNGYYVIRTIDTVSGDWFADMVSDGLTPASAASEALNIQTDPWVDDTGALGQPLYSRAMIDWKDDNFLIDNADFPMFNIDSDAGKYLVGQDASGNNHGFNFVDNAEFGIRSRKLVRNMGWQEIDATGLVTAEYAAIRSNATVEDNDRDLGYYQFGTDTTVDDTVDFEFAGPVDEAIKVFDATVTRADDYAVSGTDTITRSDGGDFVVDGYKVGGSVVIDSAEDPANDGTHVITSIVGGANGSITMTGSTLTNNLNDTTMNLSLDNRFAFSLKLRPRDDDALGKTFAQQGLGNALATQLSNRAFIFGLGTVEDANITATDVTIVGSSPYTGMSITFHSTPQARGAATLVGGARNFGIIIEGNSGTAQQIYEFVQWSLRQLTDIDADADTNIGRTIDGLLRFNGSVLEFGSVDGGLTFPTNPDGGGGGVYCDNVAAADANNVKFFDNLAVLRSNKETIAVTLDFNAILIDDTVAEGTLYYDRTVRTTPADLVVNAGGTITSAGANLPVLDGGNGAYVRLSGFTGVELAANGIYQVVTETSQSSWTVVRYDNAAMITTASSAIIPIDEHPFNAPDSIVVDTTNLIDAITISFTAPDTISDSGSGLGIFSIGDSVRIEGAGAGANAGQIVKILTAAAGVMTIEQGQFDPTLVTQGAGSQVILTEVARVDADADYSFNYGFDDNVQGGRSVSTETFVRAKALGRETAQYTSSAVLSIQSGTPLTVPLQSQQERNVVL
jgi:hypothetical protein